MRAFISIVLALLVLHMQLVAQPLPTALREQVAKLPPSSLIQVKTKAGDKLRGRLMSRTDSGFSWRNENGTATRTMPYDQVLSVSRIATHAKRNWIIVGLWLA